MCERICLCERERECVCMCVRERERERERERDFFVSILRDFAVKMSHLSLASCQDVPSLVRRSLCVREYVCVRERESVCVCV